MKVRQLRPGNRVFLSILTGLLLLSTGCSEEPISNYKAPRPDGQKQDPLLPPNFAGGMPGMANAPSSPNARILGAAILDKDTTIYVKLIGSGEVVEKYAAQLDQFIGSLKFTGQKESPLTWTVPEGWKPGKGNQFSLAAFALPVEGKPLEVTISSVGGPLLENLNRWRTQVGLAPVNDAGIAEFTKPMEVDGRQGYRVDLKSEEKPATPPVAVRPATNQNESVPRILGAAIIDKASTIYVKVLGPSDVLEKHVAQVDQFIGSLKFTGKLESPLSWTVPEGWKPGKGNQFSIAAFALPTEGKPIEVTISSVGGSLLENLNRWRNQVGLSPVTEAGMSEFAKPLEVDGHKGYRVDLKPEPKASIPVATPPVVDRGAKDGDTRILGAVIPLDSLGIYIKLMGPTEVIDKNEAGFDQFLKSLKFTGKETQPLAWTLPDGWTVGKGNQFSIAAFALPNPNQSIELTISPVGGSIPLNINRWRTQLKVPTLDESKLGEMSKEIQIDGRKAYRVSIKGTGGATGMTPPFMKK